MPHTKLLTQRLPLVRHRVEVIQSRIQVRHINCAINGRAVDFTHQIELVVNDGEVEVFLLLLLQSCEVEVEEVGAGVGVKN